MPAVQVDPQSTAHVACAEEVVEPSYVAELAAEVWPTGFITEAFADWK